MLSGRCPGPDAQVGLLAVGEEALVEQPDLGQALAPQHHERAVGVVGVLPAVPAPGGAGDAAEVRVDHRRLPVAHIGAGQAGQRLTRQRQRQASRLGRRPVGS